MRKNSSSSSVAFGALAFLSFLQSLGVPTQSTFGFWLPIAVSHPTWPLPSSYPHPQELLLLPEAWGREILFSAFPVLILIFEIGPIPPSRSWSMAFLCCQSGSAVSLLCTLLDFSRTGCSTGFSVLPCLTTCFTSASLLSFFHMLLPCLSLNQWHPQTSFSASLLPLYSLPWKHHLFLQNLMPRGSQAPSPLRKHFLNALMDIIWTFYWYSLTISKPNGWYLVPSSSSNKLECQFSIFPFPIVAPQSSQPPCL